MKSKSIQQVYPQFWVLSRIFNNTAAILLHIYTINPVVTLTLDVLCISVISNNHANIDSMSCLIEDTVLENMSSVAFPICLSTWGTFRGYLTGESNSDSCMNILFCISLFRYALLAKKTRCLILLQLSRNTFRSFSETGVSINLSGIGSLAPPHAKPQDAS